MSTKLWFACAVLAVAGCKGKDKKEPATGSAGSAAPATGSGSAEGSGSAAPAGSAAPSGGGPPAAGAVAAPGGTLSNDQASAQDVPCEKKARDVKGNEGTSWFMKCPACPNVNGQLWGTDLYTDDSKVCIAAIHAGAITNAGGVVLVTWVGGQPTYVGSTRNGIITNDYGERDRSFYVQSVNATGQPTSPPVKPPPAGTIKVSCKMPGNVWTKKDDVRVQCPPGCGEGPVWGTDVYSSDSTLCVAAVHAGMATVAAGGEFTLSPYGAVEKLAGSEKNGIVSDDYGAYDTTFKLKK